MNIIAAVDTNWAIGNRGGLLVSIPRDQKMFREMTIPQEQPLTGRTNIILSRDISLEIRGAQVVHSIEELLEVLESYDSRDVYIVGGESVYGQMLPYCDTAHITKIDYNYQSDAYFPNLDMDPEWHITADSDELTYFDLEYTFTKYERI